MSLIWSEICGGLMKHEGILTTYTYKYDVTSEGFGHAETCRDCVNRRTYAVLPLRDLSLTNAAWRFQFVCIRNFSVSRITTFTT